MAKWADILQAGSYGGVEFDFVSVVDTIANEVDSQELANTDGAFQEVRARKARSFQIVGVFIDDDYPATMDALIDQIEQGVPKEFVHPVFGSFQAVIAQGVIHHDVEDARDSATIDLTVLEHTDSSATSSSTPSVPALANKARSSCDDASASAADLYTLLADDPTAPPAVVAAALAVPDLCGFAASTATSLEDDSGVLTLAEIEAQINSVRSSVNAQLDAISDYTSPEMFAMARNLSAMADAVTALGDFIVNQRPPLIEVEVEADTPLLVWASEHGYDVADLLQLNPYAFADPLAVPARTKLRVYAQPA